VQQHRPFCLVSPFGTLRVPRDRAQRLPRAQRGEGQLERPASLRWCRPFVVNCDVCTNVGPSRPSRAASRPWLAACPIPPARLATSALPAGSPRRLETRMRRSLSHPVSSTSDFAIGANYDVRPQACASIFQTPWRLVKVYARVPGPSDGLVLDRYSESP
jgi:hypothetical protein